MQSNLDKEAANLRREELLDTFEDMVAFGAAQGVRVIIIAGDLFDKPNVRKVAKNRVKEQLLTHPDIDFCYIRGNHDQSAIIEDMMADGDISNLKLFGADQWTSYDYDEVVITGMELAKENSQTLGTNLVLDQNRCNIVVLHGQESEYEGKDKTEIINLSMLRGKYIDYLALGHIHSYKCERLDDRGVYCYSGCLEGRGFDECGDKGCVLLDITDGKVTHEFVPMARRLLHEVTVTMTPDMDMLALIEAAKVAVADISTDDLVKVIVAGERQMDVDVDMGRLLRSLDKDFFFRKGYDRTRIAIDYEGFAKDKSLKGEFVRLLQSQEDMSESLRSAVIELGIKAIMGEEIDI